jgi:glycerophosphoryl diester phosphodiesterase
MLLTIAHRAGNAVGTLREALATGVDLVECDVHRYRRALEIRHRKWLGPGLLWDRGELVRRSRVEVPSLATVLATVREAGAGRRLMLDLKGLHPGLAPAVAAELRALAPGVPVVVCTQHWWMLTRFAADPHVRLVLSAGSRRGLHRLRGRLGLPSRLGPFGVSVRRDLLSPAVVADLRAAVPHVLTWPVDTADDLAEARRLGVSGVIGKSLPLLRGVIDANGHR